MDFDDVLIEQFEFLDLSKFTVSLMPPKIFVCGGEIDGGHLIPKSLRERLINHYDDHDHVMYHACIKAENFKDYFKDGAYADLLAFETDIANIATLIIICLEGVSRN